MTIEQAEMKDQAAQADEVKADEGKVKKALEAILVKWQQYENDDAQITYVISEKKDKKTIFFTIPELLKKFNLFLKKNIDEGINHDNCKTLEEIRRCLAAIRDTESIEKFKDKNLYDLVFQTQLLLTDYFPLNDRDPESGNYQDPITFADFEGETVSLAIGKIYSKKFLIDYYKTPHAFINKKPRDPDGNLLSVREINNLESKGVEISTSYSLKFGVFATWVAASCAIFGGLVGIGLLFASLISLSPLWTVPLCFEILIVSALGGAFSLSQGEGWDGATIAFWRTAAASLIMAAACAIALPYILSGLVTLSIISPALATFALLHANVFLWEMPVVTLLAAGIRQCFHPSGFYDVLNACTIIPLSPFIIAGGLAGIVAGAVIECFCCLPTVRAGLEEREERPVVAAAPAPQNGSQRAMYDRLNISPQRSEPLSPSVSVVSHVSPLIEEMALPSAFDLSQVRRMTASFPARINARPR